ncbi:MAG TPA: UPF0280 family protein [Geminicoccaceae bacterium]|nr:UPF0280 family protein [Geminicoccaceae bacterium]
MTGGPQAALLPDGRRLHLHHGPIDIVAEAFGPPAEVRRAYRRAVERFQDVLETLVAELPVLRAAVTDGGVHVRGPVARRMAEAVWPHRATFITPMAAVAGAVADELLAAMVADRTLTRAYVNDGGDIAFHLAPGQSLRAGLVNDQDAPAIDAGVELTHAMPARGLATSGWRGRSHSLGIADAATVLARTAAAADAAATLVANAVNVEHPAVGRAPANSLRDDTDLGDRLVTVAVGPLPDALVEAALASGAAVAEAMRARGLIHAAYLALQGRVRVVGGAPAVTGGLDKRPLGVPDANETTGERDR